MGIIDDVRERRRDLLVAAGKAYQARTPEREEKRTLALREGSAAADSPERVELYRNRQSLRPPANPSNAIPFSERIIGPTLDFENRPPDEVSVLAGDPVGRIVNLQRDGYAPEGFATGFMVTPSLLLTSHHVFATLSDTVGTGVQFGYQYDGRGLRDGEIFELDGDRFFLSDEKLDFALVAVKARGRLGGDLASIGYHKLIGQTGKILLGQPVSIIQHPDGRPKTWATRNNRLLDILDLHLHYETDTLPGSSGSPAFNGFWEVVALHHSGVPRMENGKIISRVGAVWDPKTGKDDEIDWIANEGVRVSILMTHLAGQAMGDAQMDALLREIASVPGPDTREAVMGDGASGSGGGQGGWQGGWQAPGCGSAVHVHGPATINVTSACGGAGAPVPVPAGTAGGPESLEKRIMFDGDYSTRRGYQTDFLGAVEVPLPTVQPERLKEMMLDRYGNPVILDYHHFSLAMNREWRLLMWSASNACYDPALRRDVTRKYWGDDHWIADTRVHPAYQLANETFYGPARKFDCGHVVGRDDNEWGATEEEIRFANSDTFHWTNCSPQHEKFNRYNKETGIWGGIERTLAKTLTARKGRAIVLAGPILRDEEGYAVEHDWSGGIVRIPLQFWKIVILQEADSAALTARGFILSQGAAIDKGGLETARKKEKDPFEAFKMHARPVAEIEDTAQLDFGDVVRDACIKRSEKIDTLNQITEPAARRTRAPTGTPAARPAKTSRRAKRDAAT